MEPKNCTDTYCGNIDWREIVKVRDILLRTGNEAIVFEPDHEQRGDIGYETTVRVLSDSCRFDLPKGQQTLANLLAMECGRQLVPRIFSNYGLGAADLTDLTSHYDARERPVLASTDRLRRLEVFTRQEAVTHLQVLGGAIALHALRGRAIYDPDQEVRKLAVGALAAMDPKGSLPWLLGVWKNDPSLAVQERVGTLLSKAIREKQIAAGDVENTPPAPYPGLITEKQIQAENRKFLDVMKGGRERTHRKLLEGFRDPVFR